MRTVVPSVKRSGLSAAGIGIARRWHVIDAEGKVLGRVATLAAKLLQGKHKAVYTPYIDTGDHVVVVNAGAVKLTGRKEDQKIYRRHSGYEGGLREERAGDAEAHGASLAMLAAASDRRQHVESLAGLGQDQRPADVHAQLLGREEVLELTVVHRDDARAGAEEHTGCRRLAPAGCVVFGARQRYWTSIFAGC